MNYEAVIESILCARGDSVELPSLEGVVELGKKEMKAHMVQILSICETENRAITIT